MEITSRMEQGQREIKQLDEEINQLEQSTQTTQKKNNYSNNDQECMDKDECDGESDEDDDVQFIMGE